MHRPVDRTAVAKQKHIRHSIGRNGIAIPRNQAFGFVAIVPSAFRTLIREISAAKIHTPNLVAPLAETGSESTKKRRGRALQGKEEAGHTILI
ncbi:Uncharacterised protein [Burkholderia pseudomallei]|uniref:WcbO domain protein n=1 Tax=Burkholderia pseudomallei TaxID=28450 RepID=A0AA40JBT6_BURPE|nr:wcbO domain protein [Burkholderia pseudomallei NAU20B-16]AHG32879.1 wcbO domain protein [Burkholderia pseudomallei MSHR511]AHG68700.1 wcbO domain protein [Burkholderia pseudomallei MSHR146]AIV61602.1 hypothetical protein Y044_2409 [Burkholderia pseudomallei MSHR2243]AIV62768.1 wcbO domain protein [Burkholderia pseudomallei K42]AIV73160.1 hypothetical protein Y028_217 [Burkholderia pseudomallei MSHR62]AIV89323.1 wcbO domain protein [Burkholderia pseudomallei B03]KGC54859.1 wcbO domain prot